MVHGTQCICEICVCGRHQCPSPGNASIHRHRHDQHQQHEDLIAHTESSREAQNHFYRKEFAIFGTAAERAAPARPKDELSLAQGPFAHREASAATAQPTNNARSTFVTSAALRRKAHQSQIEFGDGTATEMATAAGGGGGMRSTYREESERALQLQQKGSTNGTAATTGAEARETRRAIRTAVENGTQTAALFGGGTGGQVSPPSSTVHRAEFGQKVAEKAQSFRPKTSELWKRDGRFESQTVSRTEFGEKGRAERASPFRPHENGSLLEANGDQFQRETSNLHDFGPKRSERAEPRRPVDSELFKSEQPLERRTVNRDDYGQQGRGDRYEAKPHGSSEIWRRNGGGVDAAFAAGRGVNGEEYGRTGAGRAERYAPVKPKESDILKGQGAFARESHQRAEFGPKRVERAEVKKRTESDIWKREGRQEMDTVSRTAYKGTSGEKAEAKRPTESHILRGEGKVSSESVARTEYGQKGGRGDRFPTKKHQEAELWHREGTMGAEGTVNRRDYAIDGKRGERYEISKKGREASSPLFDPDIHPNQPPVHPTSVHRSEFVPREGAERAQQRVRTEEGADLLRGDGTFLSETSKSVDYQQKKGERFDAKRPEPSDIWKHEGTIERRSINRDEYYSHGRAERVEPKRPTESDILKGQGAFARESHQRAEFGPKRAERAEVKKPTDSELFRHDGTIGEMGTVSRTDYASHHGIGDRYERRVPPESGILVPASGALSTMSTVSREEFSEKRAEPVQPHRPVAQFRLDQQYPLGPDGQPLLDYTTVSREDFGEKKVPLISGDDDDDAVAWSGPHRTAAARNANSEPNLLQNEPDMARWAREYGTHTRSQEEFGPKEVVERMVPVPHGSQLSITEPGGTFDSGTIYSEHFQVSPESFTHIERPQQIRPSTALRLSGNMDMVTGYRTEFQNKVKPCPAGELVDSLKKEDDQLDTEHFQFHAINKGHRIYKSKENLAAISTGEKH